MVEGRKWRNMVSGLEIRTSLDPLIAQQQLTKVQRRSRCEGSEPETRELDSEPYRRNLPIRSLVLLEPSRPSK